MCKILNKNKRDDLQCIKFKKRSGHKNSKAPACYFLGALFIFDILFH
jgi:hypothetical protein